jgi:hypothetical protein
VLGIEVKEIELDPPEPTVYVAIDSNASLDKAVTLLDAAEKGLLPVELDALTVKVYEVSAVNPATVMGDEPVPVTDPGVEVAVNVDPVPPVVAAVYVTVADSIPAVALPIVGVSGTSAIATPDLVMPDVFALLILANLFLHSSYCTILKIVMPLRI